jgi:hypothetical protein
MSHQTKKIEPSSLSMSENGTDFNLTIDWLNEIIANTKGRGQVHLSNGALYPFLHIEDKYRVVRCQKVVKCFGKIAASGYRTAYDAMKGIDKWIGDIDRSMVGAGGNHIYFQYPATDGTSTRFAIIYFDPYFY